MYPFLMKHGIHALAIFSLFGANAGVAEPLEGKLIIEAQLLKFRHAAIEHSYYDGKKNDLLTAGLGLKGLASAVPPGFKNGDKPSPEELRRLAIYSNYRAIVSTSKQSGFGEFYGPSASQGPVAGHEYQTQSFYPDGSPAANFVVQVPDSFNPQRACIVAAPASGSRGVWGAIGTAGDWGLRQGCAVAYTDKGTGTGFSYLDGGQHYSVGGQLLGQQNQQQDIRVASKHAHSQKNVEQDWGRFTVQAVQMAFYLLNQHHREQQYFRRDNTTVIASSISNGGNSVLRSAEADAENWIDAIVASEPTIILPQAHTLTVESSNSPYHGPAYNILAIANTMALYQPCAVLAHTPTASIFAGQMTLRQAHFKQRCSNLKKTNLLHATTPDEQAIEAQEKLSQLGFGRSSYSLQGFAVAAQLWEALSINYSNSYGRYSIEDQLCGFSYGATSPTGLGISASQALRHKAFGLSSGIPPTAGIGLLRQDKPQGDYFGWYHSTQNKLDPSFEPLRCLQQHYQHSAIQTGLKEAAFTADFNNKPTIIIHGIKDSLVFINHNSRALMSYRAEKYPQRHNVHYYEIDNAQHFDSLLALPEFGRQLVPLHHYYEQALDLMWAHLRNNTPLPPHQQVASFASSTGIGQKNLPPIKYNPGKQAIKIGPKHILLPN